MSSRERGLPVETWFQEVNAAIGFALLVPKQQDDLSFVELTVGAYSKSEEIGCKGNGKQTIGGSKKFTVIHELLHALGFMHEQLHRNLPWDDTDPVTAPAGELMFTWSQKLRRLSPPMREGVSAQPPWKTR